LAVQVVLVRYWAAAWPERPAPRVQRSALALVTEPEQELPLRGGEA